MIKLEFPPDTSRDGTLSRNAGPGISSPSMPIKGSRIIRANLRFVPGTVLFVTILAAFVPLEPVMPNLGLDMSWMFAMNQAVAQRLVFGRDVILTFGPYASIYTKLYHPSTDRLMICGSLFLGLAYFLLLLLLGKNQKPYWVLSYGLLIAGFVNSRDALLYSYPLIVGLVAYRLTLPDEQSTKLSLAKPIEKSFAVLFAPLGLLPLIKVSLLPICGITAALCGVLLWHRGKKALSWMAIAVAAISCALLWTAAGQPILALPRFVLSTAQIIAGYTEAMAFPGDPWEWILFLVASAVIVLVVAWTAPGPRSSRVFLAASYTIFLFTAFKGGFVRQDRWHNITAGSSIIIAALLLMFILGEKRSLLPIAVGALAWTYIGHGTIQAVPDELTLNVQHTFGQAFHGALKRLSNDELKKEYEQGVAAIHTKFPIARMPGTTDIYSSEQSWLFASENVWNPRPVAQSYSAYTPDLAALNLLHLESAGAPDNIVFRVEPIDGRLPSLEDGLSWPALINGYSLLRLDAQAAYLRKRPTGPKTAPQAASDLDSANHEFGEEVFLPDARDPLFARMEVTPTLLGRILGAVFKPPELHISMRLRDGKVAKYRVLSNMMRTDFLITPLVRTTEEFALLAAGGTKYLTGNEVKSITMSSEDRRGLFWKRAYSLRLRKLEMTKNTEAENSLLFDKMSEATPPSLSPASVLKCEGSIEYVNGNRPSSGVTSVEGALFLSGWIAVTPEDGIVPDSVFASLTNERGKTIYVRAHSTPRDDVRQHFGQSAMPDPGYMAMIDLSGLKGRYVLGLARTYKGNLGICQQFRLPLLINP